MCHCGPTLLMVSVGGRFYCTGARLLARQVCRQCIIYRKIQAKAQTQLMGQLPESRVKPAKPFATTGIDYCGPFIYREGRGRCLKKLEGYIAVFVCFVCKAVHLEPVTDQSTGTFVAALHRFTARRNKPRDIYSDNGENFVGAKNDLEKLYQLLGTDKLPPELQTYLVDNRIVWHTIPARAPHFGGLWEAAVKSAKHHLKRVIGKQVLSFEEMLIVTCQVEACLNSRPLGEQFCHNEEGIEPLTPGHFLTGASLTDYPETTTATQMSLMKRWTLCQQIVEEFWERWSTEYLNQLQASQKWNKTPQLNRQVDDIVLMNDSSKFKMNWGIAQVKKVYPGKDGKVRAVDVLAKKVAVPDPAVKRPLSVSVKCTILRRPVTKLSLLIPASKARKEVKKPQGGCSGHRGCPAGRAACCSWLITTNLTLLCIPMTQYITSYMPLSPALLGHFQRDHMGFNQWDHSHFSHKNLSHRTLASYCIFSCYYYQLSAIAFGSLSLKCFKCNSLTHLFLVCYPAFSRFIIYLCLSALRPLRFKHR